tara:strand:+ start:2326 stop:2592 length:267 start_codon:yes stop_codon:yes gene_type:complete
MGKVKDMDSREYRMAQMSDLISDISSAINQLSITMRRLSDMQEEFDERTRRESEVQSTIDNSEFTKDLGRMIDDAFVRELGQRSQGKI